MPFVGEYIVMTAASFSQEPEGKACLSPSGLAAWRFEAPERRRILSAVLWRLDSANSGSCLNIVRVDSRQKDVVAPAASGQALRLSCGRSGWQLSAGERWAA